MFSLWSYYGDSAVLYKVRRKLLSQNFLYSRTLINSLVRRSSVGPNDTVLEIGPGKGFITAELLRMAKKVIAVELDEKLIWHLHSFFGGFQNLELRQADFLKFPLLDSSYKVFANIPFSIEGEVIRKLLDAYNPPEDSYLIVDERLARRLSGIPHENQFSLKHKPWFDFSIHYKFRRSDFIPEPKVDAVMWRAIKKIQPIIELNDKKSWEKFIEIAFGQGTLVERNLRGLLSNGQVQKLKSDLNFSLKLKPGYLSFKQWVQIFQSLYKVK